MVKYVDRGTVVGVWKSAFATHEYEVSFTVDGSWSSVDLIEYGEWFTLSGEAAREYLPSHVVCEIDDAIAEHTKESSVLQNEAKNGTCATASLAFNALDQGLEITQR